MVGFFVRYWCILNWLTNGNFFVKIKTKVKYLSKMLKKQYYKKRKDSI